MSKLKYFIQFLGITFLFILYKFIGLKFSSILSGYLISTIGPLFRSNVLSDQNLKNAFPRSTYSERKKILKKMWYNYGQILSEYIYIKDFRLSQKFRKKILIENQKVLEK